MIRKCFQNLDSNTASHTQHAEEGRTVKIIIITGEKKIVATMLPLLP